LSHQLIQETLTNVTDVGEDKGDLVGQADEDAGQLTAGPGRRTVDQVETLSTRHSLTAVVTPVNLYIYFFFFFLCFVT